MKYNIARNSIKRNDPIQIRAIPIILLISIIEKELNKLFSFTFFKLG